MSPSRLSEEYGVLQISTQNAIYTDLKTLYTKYPKKYAEELVETLNLADEKYRYMMVPATWLNLCIKRMASELVNKRYVN